MNQLISEEPKIGLIYQKMNLVMNEIGSISKDQTNTQQGFKFRGIDQFINAIYPCLVRNGIIVSPRCVSYDSEMKDVIRNNGKKGVDKHVKIKMEYDFIAQDGSKVTSGPIPSEGLDSGDKATNKALSAALKYALIQTFFVPTLDMEEADKDSPEIGLAIVPRSTSGNTSGNTVLHNNPDLKVTQKQLSRLFAISKQNGWSNEDLRSCLFDVTGLTSTRDLTQNQYHELCGIIEAVSPDHEPLDYDPDFDRMDT